MELDCKNKTERRLNCSNHFSLLRPKIKEIVISRHFKKDFLDYEIAVKDILDCNHSNFTELHKFEEHVEGNKLFRAKNNKFHIVYAVDNKDRIIFLRALKNFKEYKKFLNNKKEIKSMIDGADYKIAGRISKMKSKQLP